MAFGHFGVGSVHFQGHQQIQQWKGDIAFPDQLVQDILSSKWCSSCIHEGQVLKEIPFLCLRQLTCAESTESQLHGSQSRGPRVAAGVPGAKALPSHAGGNSTSSARVPPSASILWSFKYHRGASGRSSMEAMQRAHGLSSLAGRGRPRLWPGLRLQGSDTGDWGGGVLRHCTCVCEKEPKAPALAPALGAAVGMASIALGVRNHNGASGSRSPVRPGTAGPSAAPQRVHKAAGRRALRCHGGASILGSKVSRPFFASPHTPPVMTGTSPFAGSPLSGLFLGYFCKQKCAVPPNVGPLSGSCIGPGRRESRSVKIRLKGFVALSCCCFGSGGVAAMARDLRSCGQKARRGHILKAMEMVLVGLPANKSTAPTSRPLIQTQKCYCDAFGTCTTCSMCCSTGTSTFSFRKELYSGEGLILWVHYTNGTLTGFWLL